MRIASLIVGVFLVGCGGKLAIEDPPSAADVDAVTEKERPAPEAHAPPPPPADPEPDSAAICAAQAKHRGTVEEIWSDEPDRKTAAISVSVRIGKEIFVNGHYETSVSLDFGGAPTFERDPVHGRTRTESFWSAEMSLVSPVPRPDAFAIGKTEVVATGSGSGGSMSCSEDGESVGGSATYGSDPRPEGTLTLTERSVTVIAGVFEEKTLTGYHRITFVSPIEKPAGTPAPSVCCLDF